MPKITEIKNIISEYKTAKNSAQIFEILYKLSLIFETSPVKHEDLLSDWIEFIRYSTDVVFLDKKFVSGLHTILKKSLNTLNQEFQKDFIGEINDIELKKYLNASSLLSMFILSQVFNEFSNHEVHNWRKSLTLILRGYEEIFEYEFGIDTISYALYCLASNDKYFYREIFPRNFDHKLFSVHLTISRALFASIFRIIPKNLEYSNIFRHINKNKESGLRNIGIICSEIYTKSKEVFWTKKYYENALNKDELYLKNYLRFIEESITDNEKIITYIFNHVCSDVVWVESDIRETKSQIIFNKMINKKIASAETELKNINDFCTNILTAFIKNSSNIDESQWSNKIFINTIKMLSIFILLNKSNNQRWINETFKSELYKWISETDFVINYNEISDDWNIIKNYVIEENDTNEWKSSFFTPTQEKFINEEAEKSKRKETLDVIVKTIIGMANQNGGTIIVGYIENPDAVIREEVKNNSIEKFNKIFFDVNFEIEKEYVGEEKVDYLKRFIQDQLASKTGKRLEQINNIFEIKQLTLKKDEKQVHIYKIDVNKVDNKLYLKKVENGVVWVTLIQRINGRTIYTNPVCD